MSYSLDLKYILLSQKNVLCAIHCTSVTSISSNKIQRKRVIPENLSCLLVQKQQGALWTVSPLRASVQMNRFHCL